MRNFIETMDKILVVIPETEVEVIEEIKKCQYDSSYGAPEVQPLFWRRAAFILNKLLGPEADADWKKRVQMIFNDKMYN